MIYIIAIILPIKLIPLFNSSLKVISVEDLCVQLNSLANTFDTNRLTNDQQKFIEYVYDITGTIPLSNKDNKFICILNATAYTNNDHNDIGFSKKEL